MVMVMVIAMVIASRKRQRRKAAREKSQGSSHWQKSNELAPWQSSKSDHSERDGRFVRVRLRSLCSHPSFCFAMYNKPVTFSTN
jgi:hypothetical protein